MSFMKWPADAIDPPGKRFGGPTWIFVCSPFRAKTPEERSENVERARQICREIASVDLIPVAPHLLFPQFLDEDDERGRILGRSFAIELLKNCDEIWVYPHSGQQPTEGMEGEIKFARKMGIRVRY